MSTIKANQHQIGSDVGTPDNNFVLETDGAGNLVFNTGNHDGVLTPVLSVGPTGVSGGVSGTFTSADSKTITVTSGIITSIV